MGKKRDELSVFEEMMIKRLNHDDSPKTCIGCPKISSNECGTLIYEELSASGGRYMKYQDVRCTNGNKVR